jgi:hypothetical protein
MMRLLMSKKVPENKRLRPRELFFILLGLVTAASLAVLWFRLAPELMQDKATWILAAASVLLFAMLLLSVNALYSPVFMDPAVAEDDWEK